MYITSCPHTAYVLYYAQNYAGINRQGLVLRNWSLMLPFWKSVMKFHSWMWVVVWEQKCVVAKPHSSPRFLEELIQSLVTKLP